MTPKSEAFAHEYAANANGTQAAIRAGYSPHSAHAQACRLLKDADVLAKIAELTHARFAHLDLTAERLDRELAKVAYFNMGSIVHITTDGDPYIDLNRATPDQLAALASAEIEDFTDRREVDAEGRPIARDVRRVKIKSYDKVAAIALAMRRLKLLVDRVEVSPGDDFAELMRQAEARAANG